MREKPGQPARLCFWAALGASFPDVPLCP